MKTTITLFLTSFFFTTVIQTATAATVTVNSPEECIAIGGTPVRGKSKRCTLSTS